MPKLEILGATFGTKHVTERVRALVKDDSLDVLVDDVTFGAAPPIGEPKTLVLAYRYEGQEPGFLVVPTGGEAVVTYSPTPLRILGAAYGPRNVTDLLRGLVRADSLDVPVTNEALGGDAWPDVPKTLALAYRYGDAPVRTSVQTQGGRVELRPPAAAAAPKRTGATDALQILGAAYGPADVTPRAEQLVDPKINGLDVWANNDTFSDTWIGMLKSLVVVYRYGDEDARTFACKENERCLILPTGRSRLRILGAAYGPVEVTEIVRARVAHDRLEVIADNSVFGDTWVGVTKTLTVVWSVDGAIGTSSVPQGKSLIIE